MVDLSKMAVDKVTMAFVEGVSVCIKGILEVAQNSIVDVKSSS